jgi:hypothetical protein
MGVDLVPQALLLERCAKAGFQQNRIERFEQIIDGAELDTTRHAVQLGQGRNHDHGKIAQPRLILEPSEHLEPVDLRHHDVEQDEVEGVRLEPRDRLFAVTRGLDVDIALEIEMQLQRVDVVVVVIDDEDAGGSSLRSILGHRAVPMNAGRRTLDHVPLISNHRLASRAHGLLVPAEAVIPSLSWSGAFAGMTGGRQDIDVHPCGWFLGAESF